MSESHIEHKPMECTDRYCGIHRDLWRHYEDVICPKTNVRQMPNKPGFGKAEGYRDEAKLMSAVDEGEK